MRPKSLTLTAQLNFHNIPVRIVVNDIGAAAYKLAKNLCKQSTRAG